MAFCNIKQTTVIDNYVMTSNSVPDISVYSNLDLTNKKLYCGRSIMIYGISCIKFLLILSKYITGTSKH